MDAFKALDDVFQVVEVCADADVVNADKVSESVHVVYEAVWVVVGEYTPGSQPSPSL